MRIEDGHQEDENLKEKEVVLSGYFYDSKVAVEYGSEAK